MLTDHLIIRRDLLLMLGWERDFALARTHVRDLDFTNISGARSACMLSDHLPFDLLTLMQAAVMQTALVTASPYPPSKPPSAT